MSAQLPVRSTAPTETPVSLDEAKAQLRVDGNDFDDLITGLIQAATDHLDGYSGILGRALVTQQWTFTADDWDDLRLPFSPVGSVISVSYYDADNALQTLSASTYVLENEAGGACIELAYGQQWPILYPRPDAISVIFEAGYGGASAVPQAIKQAILLLVGHWFMNREAVNIGNITTALPMAVDALLAPYRRVGI